jgi:hypothetical protein
MDLVAVGYGTGYCVTVTRYASSSAEQSVAKYGAVALRFSSVVKRFDNALARIAGREWSGCRHDRRIHGGDIVPF